MEPRRSIASASCRSRESAEPEVQLRLLPALPEHWQSGLFRGLRGRGGFEVDVSWEAGEIVSVDLRFVGAIPYAGDRANDVPGSASEVGPRCRILSRTHLVQDRRLDPMEDDRDGSRGGLRGAHALLEEGDGEGDDAETVRHGGVSWKVLDVAPLRPGQRISLVPAS